MMVLRPIEKNDFEALWDISHKTGVGFTSLQPDRDLVEGKISWAVQSFSAEKKPREAFYLFVLEDKATSKIAGVAGIKSAIGLDEPLYHFKLHDHMHSYEAFNIDRCIHSLSVCSDHAGSSELCTLFLLPEYRHSDNGRFLSKSRLMFMGSHIQCFNQQTIAELRGYFTEDNQSPFWEDCMKKFFGVDFLQADQARSKSKRFVAQLMPSQPILTCLLSQAAQDSIGKTHERTTAARVLLEHEGFRYTKYVDIFDGGPLLEASTKDIHSIRNIQSKSLRVNNDHIDSKQIHRYMVANNQFQDFRCIMTQVSFQDESTIELSSEQAELLNASEGDTLSLVMI